MAGGWTVSTSQIELYQDRYRPGTEVTIKELKGNFRCETSPSGIGSRWRGGRELRLLVDLTGVFIWSMFDLLEVDASSDSLKLT